MDDEKKKTEDKEEAAAVEAFCEYIKANTPEGGELDVVDALCDFLRENMPKKIYTKKNEKTFPKIEEAISKLIEVAKKSDENAEIKIEQDKLIGTSIALDIITDYFIPNDDIMMKKFREALEVASSIEILPYYLNEEDGGNRFIITFGFNDAYELSPLQIVK